MSRNYVIPHLIYHYQGKNSSCDSSEDLLGTVGLSISISVDIIIMCKAVEKKRKGMVKRENALSQKIAADLLP